MTDQPDTEGGLEAHEAEELVGVLQALDGISVAELSIQGELKVFAGDGSLLGRLRVHDALKTVFRSA